MKTSLGHLQLNIDAANLPFYKALAGVLGWETIYDDPGMFGVTCNNSASLWFSVGAAPASNNYDGPGVNHIGITADSIADVDAVAAHVKTTGVDALFETPRHRPEFSASDAATYYQVMFESPDRILWEVVYIGPK